MSKPRDRWWGFARRMIRDYPTLKRAWADLHAQSMVADTTGMPRGGSTGRTVESIALRQLPDPEDQKAFDAVARAIEETELRADGGDHMDLITMVYWSKRNLRLKDAALKLHISEQTAKAWHGEFVRLVGKHYGFKTVPESQKNVLS